MLKLPRRGVCTTWLANLAPGTKLQVGLQKGFITLPRDPATPVVCVGPGTGVAPMRAVIQERLLPRAGVVRSPREEEDTLYFGCRSEAKDHHYGAEWRALAAEGKLVYRAAFSRDGPRKVYIQHKMREDADALAHMLWDEEGVFYLCGPTWPVPDVYEALVGALVQHAGVDRERAGAFLEGLKEEERYVLEVY